MGTVDDVKKLGSLRTFDARATSRTCIFFWRQAITTSVDLPVASHTVFAPAFKASRRSFQFAEGHADQSTAS